MFLLKIDSIAVPAASCSELRSGKFYRFTKEIQQNTILNRATIELLGAELPTAGTELIGRNWVSAVESIFRISLFIVVSLFVPLLFIPGLNKLAADKFTLPGEFKKHFLHQFEDLTHKKNTKEDNEKFKQKLVAVEGEAAVKQYLGPNEEKHESRVQEYKSKLAKAKSDVMQKDILYVGLLTYMVPWVQNWFTKNILGVVGFTGEETYLDESQKDESVQLHEKTKWIKFPLGFVSTIFGSNWYSDKVYKAVTSKNEAIGKGKFMNFIKHNLKQFDYYKEIYANKLNLAGSYLFGADFGVLLACRSLNELCERILRLAVFWPTLFLGVEWVNYKLGERSDRLNGTKLVDHASPKELGIRQIRSLEELENALQEAESKQDKEQAEVISKSIKGQIKNYWTSIMLDSAVMSIGLTSANIVGTKIRVEKFGIY